MPGYTDKVCSWELELGLGLCFPRPRAAAVAGPCSRVTARVDFIAAECCKTERETESERGANSRLLKKVGSGKVM